MKKIVILIFFLTFLSCQKTNTRNYEEENTYQIITFLTDNAKDYLVRPPVISIPPNPNAKSDNVTTTCQDSLKGYEYHYKQLTKKKIIALNTNMFSIKEKYRFKNKCRVNDNLLEKFNSLKKSKKIDLEKIGIFDKDTLIQYKKEYKNYLGEVLIK